MARRSLKPQLNQIRTWVRQGRTDAWIAHQLDVSVKDISAFKQEHELAAAEQSDTESDLFGPRIDEDEPDLRAEDEALVAAALEAEGNGDGADEDDGAEGAGDARWRRGRGTASHAVGDAAGAVAAVAERRARRSTAPSTTARRATGCGSTRPSRMTPSTQSTGPATAR